MSEVLVVEIGSIEPHPNADKLELVQPKEMDYWVAVRKGELKIGDKAVYFLIDSVLPPDLESYLFPPDSKIKLDGGRIRAIKIRSYISQGLLVPLEDIAKFIDSKEGIDNPRIFYTGQDLTEKLGVIHYEPPQQTSFGSGLQQNIKKQHSNFVKYTKLENIRNYPNLFEDGELVIVTEKIHGTNFRAGWVPYTPKTWYDRLRKFLHILPQYEFVYGSHNVELKPDEQHTFYDTNVYWRTVNQYELKKKIKKGDIWFGEIHGKGIQKGYTYGFDDTGCVFFDIYRDGGYLPDRDSTLEFLFQKVPVAPLLYAGEYSLDLIKQLAEGPSRLGTQEHREGVVVKPYNETIVPGFGRKILKVINPEYLLLKTTDWH